MKKSVIVIVAVLLVVVAAMVAGSVTALADTKQDVTVNTKVAHISDIHIMIEEYCNIYSADYQAAGNTSYKMLEQTPATAKAVFTEMYKDASGEYKDAKDIPMYVVVTGDLTSNGELADHIGVARLFALVTEEVRSIPGMEGFQIFAIPGNHDIDNQHASSYSPAPNDATFQALLDAERDAEAGGNPEQIAQATQDIIDYLAGLSKRSVETTTMLQFMSIYSDYGYCNCPDKAHGHHTGGCKIAEGVCLDFFYESDYWYEGGVTRSARPEAVANPIYLAKNYDWDEFADLDLDEIGLTDVELDMYRDYIYQTEYKVYTNGKESDALSEALDVPTEVQKAFKQDKDMEYYAEYSRHGACSYVARMDGVTILGIDANSHKYTGYDADSSIAVKTSRGWHETTGGYFTKAQLCWIVDSLRNGRDAEKGQLVLALAHENVLPHFDTEDEVISLFTYDNWEDVYTNLADNGVRYVFTGHQHTNDIESDVAQSGSVFYDVETGSTTCMGAGWRELDFVQTNYANGDYSEDVYSTMHFLHSNTHLNIEVDDVVIYDGPAFEYNRYEVGGMGDYMGRPMGTYYKTVAYQMDAQGNYQDLAEYLALSLKGMIKNMAGNIVNENLMDTLRGFAANLGESFFGNMVNQLIDDMDALNLHEFVVKADGSFELGDIKQGYNLTTYAIDFVDYFLGYDYSFGEVQGGLHLDDVLLYVYGNHLIGAQDYDKVPDDIQALLDVLEDGRFVRFLEDLLYRGLVPQLEVILNAPIYWGEDINYGHIDATSYVTKADVAGGKGFDMSDYGAILKGEEQLDGMMGTLWPMVLSFLAPDPDSGIRGIDISSIIKLLRSIPPIINDPTSAFLMNIVYELAGTMLGKDIAPYVDLAMTYLSKLDTKSLSEVLKDELLDKYVTDAFCKNLGAYAAYIVRSVVLDDSRDGVLRTDSDSLFPYEEQADFHLTLTYANTDSLQGHTFYLPAGGDVLGKGVVNVIATTQNGLLPGKITLGNVIDDEGNLDVTQKQIRWFTQRDVDYTNICKDFEVNPLSVLSDAEIAQKKAAAKQFQCELEYGTAADLVGATKQVYTGENVWIEYPTVDLGIAYFNLTYAYRQYNNFDITLSGLTAGTTYYYRIRSIDGDTTYDWTPIYSFTTPAAEGGIEVLAITDIQGSIEQNYTASLYNMLVATLSGDPAYIISCGDNVDKSENIAQWEWLLDGQKAVWANYAFSGVVGNHEDHNYSTSYVTATPAVATVDETGFYYSYNYQNVHFVMLNTNDIALFNLKDENGDDLEDEYGDPITAKGLGEAQYNWLVADLAAAKQNANIDFIVVALHKGPYTSGSHAFDSDVIGLRAQLTPIFYEYGVDLVLQGHDHTYSVSEFITTGTDETGRYNYEKNVNYDATGAAIDPAGVLYVNLGTMGDKYYNYIYSPEVTLKDRSGDAYTHGVLSDYYTDKGNLELSPVRDSKTVLADTPVYAYLTVKDKKLALVTYTIIDGVSYMVDDVVISKGEPVVAHPTFTVEGVTYDQKQLNSLKVKRVAIEQVEGTVYYSGYSLADLYSLKGREVPSEVKIEGIVYNTDCVMVAVAQADGALGESEAIDPVYIIAGIHGTPTVIIAAPEKAGLPTWATAVIVGAAVLVAAGAVLLVLLAKKNNPKAPGAANTQQLPEANAEATEENTEASQEGESGEEKSETDSDQELEL